ncbi:hypothetical protein HK104_004757 [Borealophlyctis nickersoniae]|nr:hypothetical protein HK104_004757 [Borealophlyctis nickersoniae]
MEDILALAAEKYFSPTNAVRLRRTSSTLNGVISDTCLARCIARHLYRTYGQNAFAGLAQLCECSFRTTKPRVVKCLEAIADLLLQMDADVQAGSNDMLRRAAHGGFDTLVYTLLDQVDQNPRQSDTKETLSLVLDWSAWEGHASIVRMSIDRGARVSRLPHYTWDRVIEAGYADVLRELLRFDSPPENTRIVNAILRGYQEIVGMLMDAGVDLNYKSAGSALADCNEDMARFLMDRGVHLSPAGAYALWDVTRFQRVDRLRMLLDGGTSVDERESLDAFAHAGSIGSEEMVSLFLDAGIDVGVVGGYALQCALMSENEAVIRRIQEAMEEVAG